MSKKDDALKLALDAKEARLMEQAQVFASAWSLVGGRFDSGNAMDDAEAAKNELRQMIREALAEQPAQQQEPKFWYDEEEALLHDHFDDEPFGCIPLYTSPQPSKPWVGLTDTEKYALADDVARKGVPVFEAICEAEANLREKNA